MEISDYLRLLRKRWPLIASITLLAILVAAAGSLLTTPQYQATAQVFVSTQAAGSATDLFQGSNFTQQRVRSYADIVSTPRVLQPVVDELGLEESPRELAERVSTAIPPETVLIDLSVTDEDPERAADIANGVAATFSTVVADLEAPSGDGTSPVRVSIVEDATAPASPVSPNVVRNLGLALVLGLLGGFGFALLRQTLDTSVRGESDVKQVTDAPVLGGIAFDPEAPKRPLIVQVDPHSTRAEAFRQLRTNLQFVDAANHPRSIVVTSSVPGEGKSTTTANLAITMASAGTRVALVEGDLRRPKIADYMGMEGAVGLTTVLIGQAGLEDVLQPWGNGNLSFLPAGQIPPNPSELLGSRAMDELLRKLEADFDMVIIDAPPLLPVTDAAVLSRLASGAVVLVGSNKIDRAQLARSLQNLESVDARVLGLVMNLLPTKGPDSYSYYSYAYSYGSDENVGAREVKRSGPRRAKR